TGWRRCPPARTARARRPARVPRRAGAAAGGGTGSGTWSWRSMWGRVARGQQQVALAAREDAAAQVAHLEHAAMDHSVAAKAAFLGFELEQGIVHAPAAGFLEARFAIAGDVHLHQLVDASAVVVPEHRSEEHTSELQSREKLVCRLLLEK